MRKSGYYWVRRVGELEWEIARWNEFRGVWNFHSLCGDFSESAIGSLDNIRIERGVSNELPSA